MKKYLIGLAAVLLLSVESYAQTLAEIVDKHAAAVGGIDNLKALKSAKFTQSTIAPGQTIDANATIVFDKALRLEMELAGNDIVLATRGTTGWVKQGDAPVQDVPAEQLKAITDGVTLYGMEVINASMKGQKIDFKGKETIDGKAYYALSLDLQGGTSTFYIDPATYLIAIRKGSIKAMGQTLEAELAYDEYKKAGALTLPYKVTTNVMGQSVVTRLTTYTPNPVIDDSIFNKPTK